MQDNEESDDDNKGTAKWRRSARGKAERLDEKKDDEKDALKELEESMQERGANATPAANTAAAERENAAAVSTRLKQEQLKDDLLFQTMLRESMAAPLATAAVVPKEEDTVDDAGAVGGWAAAGVAGGGAEAATAAPVATGARATSGARARLFDEDDTQKDKKRGAQWVLQVQAETDRGRGAAVAAAADAGGRGVRDVFVAERDQVRLTFVFGPSKAVSQGLCGCLPCVRVVPSSQAKNMLCRRTPMCPTLPHCIAITIANACCAVPLHIDNSAGLLWNDCFTYGF
jgi:hypothetical protein